MQLVWCLLGRGILLATLGGASAMIPDNCFSCKWKRAVPGSAHVRCGHPKLARFYEPLDKNPILELGFMLGAARGGPTVLMGENPLGVRGDPHGIKNGWFNWPYEFDPTWLDNCDGYTRAEVPAQ